MRNWPSICQALDAADAAEPVEPPLSRAELEAKIAALQEKREWHAELLGQLDADQTQISVTRPGRAADAHGQGERGGLQRAGGGG